MRSRSIFLGTLVAAMALAPASGAAPRTKVASSIQISGLGYGPGEAHLDGSIESARPACLSGRRVRMFAIRQNGEANLISVDRSSLNGFWGGEGDSSRPKAFRAVMKPRDISRRKTCTGDTFRVAVPSGPGIATSREALPTTVLLGGSQIGPSFVSVDGSIRARKACRAKRRVDILALTGTGAELIDFDRASRNGWFGGGGPATGATGVRVLAPAKDIPGPDTCAEGSDERHT